MEVNIDFEEIIQETIKNLGQVNIIIAGKTGVGKSTLINAVFNEDMAETGVGRPVTQCMREYSKEGSFYHIFDTKGFELDSYQEMKENIIQEIRKRKSTDPKEHLHIMWYCVSDEGKRIEPAEIDFIKEITKEIPTIWVFTKAMSSDLTFFNKVKEENYNTITHLIRVLALGYETPIGVVPPFGIQELIELTYNLLPDAAKKAFAAAQKVNKELKKKTVNKLIVGAASAAAAAGATPIPFSDAIVLAPIQIGMIAGISSTFGMELSSAFISTIVTSAAGVVGATYAGRAIVSGLLKLIPTAGSIIGGTISATTAATLTTLMGWAYYNTLVFLQDNNMELTPDNIAERFKKQLKMENNKE